MNFPKVNANMMDKAIGFFSPETEARRLKARAASSFLTGGYPIPGDVSDRSMRGWGVSGNVADADTLPGLGKIRAGSRDLFMNTPIPVAILKRFKTNVVGFGLSMDSHIDAKFLGLSKEQKEEWEENVEREWALWAENKNECDSARTQCFSELQALAFFSHLLSGDCFAALPYVTRPGGLYKLKVKLIEADMISNPPTQLETYNIAGGIEVDDDGAPVAYHVRNIPKEFGLYSNYANYNTIVGNWKRVEAFGGNSGRPNMLHLFQKDRPGQRRGVPLLAPVLSQIKQISRLSESELMAAIVTSMLTVFLEGAPGNAGLPGFSTGSMLDPTNVPQDVDNIELGYGSVISLPPGQKISMADPNRPNAAFDPFFTALVKQISAACELPFELVLLHFSASYSATRGVMVEAWKIFKERRIWLSRNFCQPIFEEWLWEAVSAGRIKAPGFLEDTSIRAAYCKAEWTGPGQGQLDPLKETQAAKARIDAKLSTHETEYTAIHGRDWKSGMERLSREKEILDDLGIPLEVATPAVGEAKKAPTDSSTKPGTEDDPYDGAKA